MISLLTKKSLAVLLAVFLIDFLSKYWASQVGNIVINTKASLGLGFDSVVNTNLVLIVATILILVLGTVWWERWRQPPLLWSLVVAGATSNVLDRLLFGGVRDWLTIPGIGIKNNIADWAIMVGLAGLLLVSFKKDQEKTNE